MKVQCPKCKDIVEMRDFVTSDEGLRFPCPACGESNFLPSLADDESPTMPALDKPTSPEGRAVPASVFEPAQGEVICPKCGHTQLLDEACHRCGLMFARYDADNLPPEPELAVAVWQSILANPDDETLHDQFLDSCVRSNRLDYASRQYRILTRSELHRQKAQLRLDRIFNLAQAHMGGQTLVPPTQGGPSRWSVIIMWTVIALLVAGAIGYIAYSFHTWPGVRL